ncbi:PLD nuclease N-terminal domain-containing protein [Pseudomonas sp. NPDC088368]|uniref:PLD nuclease N-terminal domain-containing protein n=1 Tax=Pseudomonas sp. NPDC088368 TaxID=3364453 RepID=UPI0038100BC1
MDMSLLAYVLVPIIVLLDLWVIASVWRTTKSANTKMGWVLLVLILPVIGVVIWGIAGPRGVAQPPTSKEHSKG